MRKVTLFVAISAVLLVSYSLWGGHHSARPVLIEDELINALLKTPVNDTTNKPAMDFILPTWERLIQQGGGTAQEQWYTNVPDPKSPKDYIKVYVTYIKTKDKERIYISTSASPKEPSLCIKPDPKPNAEQTKPTN